MDGGGKVDISRATCYHAMLQVPLSYEYAGALSLRHRICTLSRLPTSPSSPMAQSVFTPILYHPSPAPWRWDP